MSDNFEKEVESAVESLSSQETTKDLSPEAQDQLRQIEALAGMDPSFANSSEYKDLMGSFSKESGQATQNEESSEQNQDSQIEELLQFAETNEEFRNSSEFKDLVNELKSSGYLEDEDEEEENVDDIFGVMSNAKRSKKMDVNFDIPDEMADFISSKFGVEDAGTFFNSVDTWRTQAQEGSEMKKEYEALTSDLNAMPYELRLGIQMWANGDDYSQAFGANNGRLDFSGEFKDQDTESLVQHYFAEEYKDLLEEYEDGDLTDKEYESRIKFLSSSTKRMFAEDKKALENEREEYLNRQNSEFQNMKKTALVSVENLSKAYPDFSKSEINKIRNILIEGKVEDLFVNSDGTYNDDAAELVAYAMYGKRMMESVKKVAQRKGETEANQRIVDSSPKSIRKQKTASPTNANQKAVGHLSGLFKGDPYA